MLSVSKHFNLSFFSFLIFYLNSYLGDSKQFQKQLFLVMESKNKGSQSPWSMVTTWNANYTCGYFKTHIDIYMYSIGLLENFKMHTICFPDLSSLFMFYCDNINCYNEINF